MESRVFFFFLYLMVNSVNIYRSDLRIVEFVAGRTAQRSRGPMVLSLG